MRIKVVHIVLNLHAGGLESVVAEILRSMDSNRFEFTVLTLEEPGRLAEELAEHATIQKVETVRGWSMIRPKALTERLRRLRPDVVHLHTGVWYKASVAAARAGVPFVLYTEHGREPDESGLRRMLDRWASRRTDLVVAVSAELEDYLQERIVGSRAPIVTLFNGVDTTRFHPRPEMRPALRRSLGLPTEAFVVGSVGRFYPVKAYDVLVRAFAEVLNREREISRECHLVLAGEGPEEESLRSVVRKLDLDPRVHFLGWRTDAPEVLPTFDVFALSSRSEGTSMSLLEAMSCGVCPVVTDVGGNARVLGADLSDRLVEEIRPKAVASALERAATHEKATRADGQRARERVLDRFDKDAMLGGYERLYASVK